MGYGTFIAHLKKLYQKECKSYIIVYTVKHRFTPDCEVFEHVPYFTNSKRYGIHKHFQNFVLATQYKPRTFAIIFHISSSIRPTAIARLSENGFLKNKKSVDIMPLSSF